MKRILTLYFLSCLFLSQSLYAQISFNNRNDLLNKADFHSGVAMGVTDMNNDGKDDIIRMDEGYDLQIEYQNGTNETFTSQYIGEMSNFSKWSMCIGDIDNNGFSEILTGGISENYTMAKANADGTVYSTINLPGGDEIFVQGSNFVDINNDGLLDAFACHDDGESRIWGNDGNGNLVSRDNWIDMSVNGNSGEPASGNYGSIWTDFDNDGDIDLYLAKCRQGVTNTTDPRRINTLYVNDGNGGFTEKGAEYGLRIGWQSWTADFQDVNNDGWLDCFITNHDHEAQLMINDGTGHYTEATNTGINASGLPVQGVMRDFDNDGWIDILISGNKGQIFKNNGDLTFTEVTGIFNNNALESFALGDLNNDGFVDVYGGYASVFTNPTTVDDVVWINNGGSNNYLSVDLEGVISNRNAVGARITIYGDWGIQIREVRAGESYGILNSTIQYFGLGTATEVDSILINWPSGIDQKEYNLSINTTLQILEGGCIATAPTLTANGPTTFCTGESVILSAPAGFASYTWSNGATTNEIEVTTPGIYALTITDDNGCFGFAESITVVVDPELTPLIAITDAPFLCEGESIQLMQSGLPPNTNFMWSNGEMGSTLTVTQSGTYSLIAEGLCGNFSSNEIVVEVFDTPQAPTASDVVVAPGETATLEASGNDLAWYTLQTGGIPFAYGEQIEIPNITVATTVYVEDRNGIHGIKESVGMLGHKGSFYSSNDDNNNRLFFNALEDVRIDSVKVYTDDEFVRRIILLDEGDKEIAAVDVNIPEGESYIYLGIDVPAGNNYSLTTDGNINLQNASHFGPRLRRSDQGVNFPYDIANIISLTRSDFGTDWYYYFFDWKVSTPSYLCPGDRTTVNITLDDQSATTNIGDANKVTIFPNPSNGLFNINTTFEISDQAVLTITNLAGQEVLQQKINQKTNSLHLDQLPKGIYLLKLVHGNSIYANKLAIQ